MAPYAPASATPAFVPFDVAQVEGSISARFEAQVTARPHRDAVRWGAATLSYRELNERSNRIANALLDSRGDTPEAVALLLPQGADLIAAILGVLKAGKHYLGLDAGFPTGLLAEIVADSGARTVLTTSRGAALAEELASDDATVLVVDGPDGISGAAVNPGLKVTADHLAYVFYTSGSTGRPKAVVDCHRNVLHNVMRYTNTLRIGPADRMTLLQSASFSGSVSSLFGALLNGACSLPIDPHATTSGRLARWLLDERITIYHSVPALFRSIVGECEALPDIRVVRLEGDQASKADLRLFASRAKPDAVLVNGLGTTETGLVSQFFVSPSGDVPGSVVPVGYPVQDMETFVVDDLHRPVPAGEVGEIAVRSRYLAVGYWRNPELTRARFLADPNDLGVRTYLTGDLGRMRADGCLEHLGRVGRRAKVRGKGVELSDIELALQDVSGVGDAAVMLRESEAAGPRLVAYYVPTNLPGPTVTALREALGRRLPPFMIPALFIELQALPLTRHGKLDRSRLPAVGRERPRLVNDYVEPRNALEDQIAGIWHELLGVGPVGVLDDFLELGGDSLTAMAMLTRIESELAEEIPVDWLLDNATVEELAAKIRDERPCPGRSVVRIQEGSGGEPFFFVHGDYLSGGYYSRRLAKEMGSHVPFYAIQPSGLNGHSVAASYEEMAEQHLPAVRRVQPEGPYYLGGTCNGGLVAYELARLLVAEGEEVAALAPFASSMRNARFRAIGRVADRLAAWFGRSPDAHRLLLRYLNRLDRGLAARGPIGLLGHALRVSARTNGRESASRQPGAGTDFDSTAIRDHYHRVDMEYLPRPYPGKVTLIWPNDEPETAEEAISWWRRLTPDVQLRRVPSTHGACLTRDVELLAAELAECRAKGRAMRPT